MYSPEGINEYFGPKYFITVIFLNPLNPVGFPLVFVDSLLFLLVFEPLATSWPALIVGSTDGSKGKRYSSTGHWKVTGRIDLKIFVSNFWPPGEGFQGFRPQIRRQHAKISMLTSFEVNWLQLKRFPKFCPVAFQWPV